jgi:hypothetical protein
VDAGKLKRCSICQVTRYCSTVCQRLAWTDGGHKRECICLTAYKGKPNDQHPANAPTIWLMARVLFHRSSWLERKKADATVTTGSGSNDITATTTGTMGFEGLRQLRSNIALHGEDKKEQYAAMSALLADFLSHDPIVAKLRKAEEDEQAKAAVAADAADKAKATASSSDVKGESKTNANEGKMEVEVAAIKRLIDTFPSSPSTPATTTAADDEIDDDTERGRLLASAKTVWRWFGVFSCNNYTIADGELIPIGMGIYPLIAMANHSCRPNAVVQFDGHRANLRAIAPIEAGEEVLVSYIDLADTTQGRRKELAQGYFFTCQCVMCGPVSSNTSSPSVSSSVVPGQQERDAILDGLLCRYRFGRPAGVSSVCCSSVCVLVSCRID